MKENRRTQAERTAVTREALITAARLLFAEHGYGAVGTETIVQAAGVSRGALYHHFGDKAELFAAVFEAAETTIVGRIESAIEAARLTEPLAMMELGASVCLDAFAEPALYRIVMLDAPAVLGWARWRELNARYCLALVERLLAHAIEQGAIPRQPAAPLAHVMLGALRECGLYLAEAGDRDRARQEAGAVMNRMISSLAMTSPPRTREELA